MEGNLMTTKNFKPVTITPHFYQLGIPFFPVYLSMGEEAMIIEGGTGATFDIIVKQIKELGIDPERIKYIALTHTHADHIGSLPHLKLMWPHIKVVASLMAAKMLSNDIMINQFLWFDGSIAEIMKSKEEITELPPTLAKYPFEVDTVAEEGDRFELGSGIAWTIHPVPGHSPCQIALHEEKEGTLVIGDSTGFYSPEKDAFWPNYFVSLEQYCNGIRKLAALLAKRAALGHNGVIEGEGKVIKFFEKALKATEAYHLEMLERISSGENPEKIALEKANWVDSFADHMPFKITQQMCQLLIKRSQKDAEKSDLSFDL